MALMVTALLGFGLLYGIRSSVLSLLLWVPQNALIAGYFNRNLEGQLHSRPPVWLLLVFLAAVVINGGIGVWESGWLPTVLLIPLTMLVVPTVIFLSSRTFAIWLQPRLNVYVQLVEYLRVMWIPIGGFGAGYLVIVIVFAGFSGMLERFSPGSFAGAADAGIGDWMSFSFFSALRAGLHRHHPGYRDRAGGGGYQIGSIRRLATGRLCRGDVGHSTAARADRTAKYTGGRRVTRSAGPIESPD